MSDVVFIAITLADDTVAVMRFILCERGPNGEIVWERVATKATVDAEVAKCSFTADKLPVKGWRPIAWEDQPKDRMFRNAWRDSGESIEHDMAHALRIAVGLVRAARQPKLDALDVETMKAVGKSDAKALAAVEAEKQALRDLPATVEAALAKVQDVEGIKAVIAPHISG
jgi:hypothetical protein